MKQIQWRTALEIIGFSLLFMLIIGGSIFFTLRFGKHLEIIECLSRSAAVLISLPAAIILAVFAAFE
ncbi:MAG: hypothetical protein LUC50_00375 [Ruminococcus sp.]|nr:hypothetical protein [Ruminococcus sp.]